MKSICFSSIPFLFENRLLTLSFAPSFLLLFRPSCSARIFAVSEAVSWFLMLLSGFELGFSEALVTSTRAGASSTVAAFLFFLPPPGAFFNECVRPCSFRLWIRCSSRSFSAWEVGRIEMMSLVVYFPLHCSHVSMTTRWLIMPNQ